MRALRRARALGGAVAAATTVASAAADVGEPVRIAYSAPPVCPDAKTFLAEIAARTPRLRLANAGETARSFAVAIAVEAGASEAAGRVSIREVDGREAAREVSGASCDEVVSALALITAVAIDPDARTEPVVAPAAKPAPAQPAPSVAPAAAPRAAPAPPARPTASPIEAAGRWQLGAGAELAVATAVAPDPAFGFEAFVEARRSTRWLPFTLRASVTYTRSASVTTSLGAAELTWIAGRLEGCPLTWPRPARGRSAQLGVSPCLALDVGALRGEGSNTVDARAETRVWLAPDLLLRLELVLFDHLVVEGQAGATVPLPSYRFYFGPDTTLFEVPRVGALAGAGVGVRLP